MKKKSFLLATHTFKGPRFEDHGLPLDVLEELLSYKNILVETAKELWRRNHPGRQRLRKNFEDSLNLKFYKIEPGSASVPIMREIEFEDNDFQFEPCRDELDEAVELVADTTDAASRDAPLPENFPKRLIYLFEDYGKTLREGESFEQKPVKRQKPAVYSLDTRKRILERSEGKYEDIVDIVGEIRAADLDGLNFILRLEDGSKIPGKFLPEQEEIITNALREHSARRLRIKGRAKFNPYDGKISRVALVEEMILQEAGEIAYDPNARPIWEIADEIAASVPAEEWEKLPKDLSKNFDHYLYGHPKEEK